jgi:hypothetical protein
MYVCVWGGGGVSKSAAAVLSQWRKWVPELRVAVCAMGDLLGILLGQPHSATSAIVCKASGCLCKQQRV